MEPTNDLKLSVLDLVPVWHGATASGAIRNAVDLARHVERLGYTRVWYSEHHNSSWLASSSPELLIGHIAGATSTIRVGSGGVMLPNHSALKVVENFRTLEAMYPKRTDLGIGRAPGTDALTALALRRSREALAIDDFPQQMGELLGFFTGMFPPNHQFSQITPTPVVDTMPEIWMLGSSDYGARFAAEHGLGFVFAHHISPDYAIPVLRMYRRNFQPSPFLDAPRSMLAASVFVAETDDEAEDVAALNALRFALLRRGDTNASPTIEDARAFRNMPGYQPNQPSITSRQITGRSEQVIPILRELVQEAQVDELMVLTMVPDQQSRHRSYELLADALQPAARQRED